MKIFLSLILCSYVGDVCMEPYVWPESYNSTFDCMIAGYEEALNKMKEIGREEVNKNFIDNPIIYPILTHNMKGTNHDRYE